LLKGAPVAEELGKEDLVAPGVSLCAGCTVELAERVTLKVLGKDLIIFMAPGCAIGSLAGIEGVAQSGVSVYSCLMTNIASSVTGVKKVPPKKSEKRSPASVSSVTVRRPISDSRPYPGRLNEAKR